MMIQRTGVNVHKREPSVQDLAMCTDPLSMVRYAHHIQNNNNHYHKIKS